MSLTKQERKMLEEHRDLCIKKLLEIEEDPSLIKYWANKGINAVKLYKDNIAKAEKKLNS